MAVKKRKPKVDVLRLEVVCVYDKTHRRTLLLDDAGQIEQPFCEIDGGPMIAAKASIQLAQRRR